MLTPSLIDKNHNAFENIISVCLSTHLVLYNITMSCSSKIWTQRNKTHPRVALPQNSVRWNTRYGCFSVNISLSFLLLKFFYRGVPDPIFWHKSSIWFQSRLHPEFQFPRSFGSALKVCVGRWWVFRWCKPT